MAPRNFYDEKHQSVAQILENNGIEYEYQVPLFLSTNIEELVTELQPFWMLPERKVKKWVSPHDFFLPEFLCAISLMTPSDYWPVNNEPNSKSVCEYCVKIFPENGYGL